MYRAADGRRDQRLDRLRPAHVTVDGDLDVVGVLGFGVGRTRRRTRERLQRIVIDAIELPPYAQVDAIVEVDRPPLVGPRPDIAGRPAIVGDQWEPLPVDVARAPGDLLLEAPQRSVPVMAMRVWK